MKRLSGFFSRRLSQQNEGKDKEEFKRKTNKTKTRAKPLARQASLNNEALIAPEFATKGIAFSVLEELATELKEKATFHDAKKLILERTRNTKGQRSLASHYRQNSETAHLVANADYFVSYAWSGSFHETIEALASHFKKNKVENPYIWIDIAMVDQFAAESTDVDFHVWAETFKASLKQIGKALIVLTPGEKPIAITRSWCCFEWASIKQVGIPFEYCVNPADVERLIQDISDGKVSFSKFNNIFSAINVEKAKAFKHSDQQAILGLMHEIGIKEVNDVIMLSVKDWLMAVANEGEKRVSQGTKAGTCLLNAKGALYEALVSRYLSYERNIVY